MVKGPYFLARDFGFVEREREREREAWGRLVEVVAHRGTIAVRHSREKMLKITNCFFFL